MAAYSTDSASHIVNEVVERSHFCVELCCLGTKTQLQSGLISVSSKSSVSGGKIYICVKSRNIIQYNCHIWLHY